MGGNALNYDIERNVMWAPFRSVTGHDISHTNWPTPGSVAIISFPYSGTNWTIRESRQESLGAMFFSEVVTPGAGSLRLSFINNEFLGNMYYPSCAFIQDWGSGPINFTGTNYFDGAANNLPQYSTTPVCPNGILSLASGLSTVNSMGTTWDNLGPSNSANAYTQALTIIPASQVNSIGDNYLTDSGVWNLLPPPTIAATSNEIQSPCPFSINKARGYKYRSDCRMSPGQIIAFPVDETIGNNWGSFDINLYGSIVCHYDYGNASYVTLHGPIENVTGIMLPDARPFRITREQSTCMATRITFTSRTTRHRVTLRFWWAR